MSDVNVLEILHSKSYKTTENNRINLKELKLNEKLK